MNKQQPDNKQADEREVEFNAFLTAIRDALETRTTAAENADSLIKIDDERQTLEAERLGIENKQLVSRLNEAEDLHKVRKKYANRLFWLVVGWLIAVLVFIALAGFKIKGFTLSDKVIIAFITSTTINVIGLFLVPARWLFPSKPKDAPK